jgi:hypothetical protein
MRLRKWLGMRLRGWSAGWSLMALAGAMQAADAYPVVAIPAHDHVVVLTRNFPVVLGLAGLEVPDDATAREAVKAKLGELMKGKKADILYAPGFGVETSGAAKVQFLVGGDNVNAAIIAAGLARFQEGAKPEAPLDAPLREAESKAKKAKVGLWAKGAGATMPAAIAAAKKGPFCTELDSPYYVVTGSAEAAALNQARVIYYPDEATAQRAGKKAKARPVDDAPQSDGSEAGADKLFADGKAVYAEAIAKGNTDARDQYYEKAYVLLTKAMQDYSALCEKKPNDEKLGEKLRECMQLRYGAVKQRRFH